MTESPDSKSAESNRPIPIAEGSFPRQRAARQVATTRRHTGHYLRLYPERFRLHALPPTAFLPEALRIQSFSLDRRRCREREPCDTLLCTDERDHIRMGSGEGPCEPLEAAAIHK